MFVAPPPKPNHLTKFDIQRNCYRIKFFFFIFLALSFVLSSDIVKLGMIQVC